LVYRVRADRAARRESHGAAAKATDACLAEKDLNGALTCLPVAEAVYVLLTEQPEHEERIH
jgi:hypothetical protein